jgi:hypothetical protein
MLQSLQSAVEIDCYDPLLHGTFEGQQQRARALAVKL